MGGSSSRMVHLEDGGSLFVEESGVGPLVLLLHGFGHDRRVWSRVLPLLDGEFRVAACDLRGFGRSSDPPAGGSTPTEDLAALLDELAPAGPVMVAGFSLGALCGLDLAARFPQKVSAAVLAGPYPGFAKLSAETQQPLREIARAAREEGVEAARHLWLRHPLLALRRPDPEAAGLLAQMTAGYSGLHWLRRDRGAEPEVDPAQVRCPVRILSGELDVEDLRRYARELAAALPAAEFTELRGAGHLLPLEEPARIAGAIRTAG